MYTENENEIKEIIQELDKRTENIPNSIDTQDWIVLSVLADAGKENAIMAIKYAYKLGIATTNNAPTFNIDEQYTNEEYRDMFNKLFSSIDNNRILRYLYIFCHKTSENH